jgi:hypothetical protein
LFAKVIFFVFRSIIRTPLGRRLRVFLNVELT